MHVHVADCLATVAAPHCDPSKTQVQWVRGLELGCRAKVEEGVRHFRCFVDHAATLVIQTFKNTFNTSRLHERVAVVDVRQVDESFVRIHGRCSRLPSRKLYTQYSACEIVAEREPRRLEAQMAGRSRRLSPRCCTYATKPLRSCLKRSSETQREDPDSHDKKWSRIVQASKYLEKLPFSNLSPRCVSYLPKISPRHF